MNVRGAGQCHQLAGGGHRLTHIERRGAGGFPAGVVEQLADHVPRRRGRSFDVLQIFSPRAFGVELIGRQVGVTKNGHQQVIEVVGNVPGHQPQTFKLVFHIQ